MSGEAARPNAADAVEALLFVSEGPATLCALAHALGLTEGQIEQALEVLERRLAATGALQLLRIAGGYQLSTKPQFAPLVEEYLRPAPRRVSRGLLEVLAVVAYRQPVTAAEIEAVRGVSSDYGLRVLVERGLLCEVGRKPVPGRPLLYGTTPAFLHFFHLNGLEDLPPVDASAGSAESS